MRPYAERGNEYGGRLFFQTSHEKSSTRESESTITKDGNIQSLSEIVVEYSLTTLMAQNDRVRDLIEIAYLEGGLIELWDINKTEPREGTEDRFPATYFQGYITEWSETAGAEDSVELSLSIAINGSGVRDFATLTPEQRETLTYAFADIMPAM
jgi:TP901-1 family phage major tail protein